MLWALRKDESLMTRKKPARRVVPQRTNNNVKRRLALTPTAEERDSLLGRVMYGAYSKHKLNPAEYGLDAYNGPDEERTYCDKHSSFYKNDTRRIPRLLRRSVKLGLWSEQAAQGVPRLLWTIDKTGWIFELRITNTGLAQYHGYPLLPGDAFANIVLERLNQIVTASDYLPSQDPELVAALGVAEKFYK